MEDGLDQAALAACASKAIQSNYKNLTKLVVQGSIPEGLFSKGIISSDTMDRVSLPSLSARDKGRAVMSDVREGVSSEPDLFVQLCDVLADEDQQVAQRMAKKLKEEFEKAKEQRLARSRQGTPERSSDPDLERLKQLLESYNIGLRTQGAPEEEIHECMKHAVRFYVDTLLELGESHEVLKRTIQALCHKDLLIPTKLQEWVKVYTAEKCRKLLAPTPVHMKALPDVSSKSPSLFTNNTLYHAGVCCQAVSTCTCEKLSSFLTSSSTGHHLEEVSMSNAEGVCRYLIARNGTTLYVAFQSEPKLAVWKQKHSTFEEGLKRQTDQLPLRFFVEQLWDKKRIVFTGFSFGGMLACYVVAIIWKQTHIPVHLLESNVACITFGQPLINIPLVQSVIQKFEKFKATIRSVFIQDDILPRLLRYLGVENLRPSSQGSEGECSQSAATPSQALQVLPEETPTATMGYQGSIPSALFQSLSALQEGQTYSGAVAKHKETTSMKAALSNLKGALDQILMHATIEADSSTVVYGSCCFISHKEGLGKVWSDLQKESANQELCSLTQDSFAAKNLESTPFKWHSMEVYRKNVLTAILEPQKYRLPSPPPEMKAVNEFEALQPHLDGAELQEYPKEVGVILKGDNLWFCHKVVLGKGKRQCEVTLETESEGNGNTRFLISFTIPTDRARDLVAEDSHMHVSVHSHFASVTSRVPVKQELYPFSTRQIQLAKQTPSEVIQLAYWSAMLESHAMPDAEKLPDDACPPSSRFKEIQAFLEEAVKIVPVESIFYAVAYADDDTALHCAKAISECRFRFIPSMMLLSGLERARIRMHSGVTARFVDQLVAAAMTKVPEGCLPLSFDVKRASGNKFEVVLHLIRPVIEFARAPILTYSQATRTTPSRGQPPRVKPQATMLVPVVKSLEVSQLAQVETIPEHSPSPPAVTANLENLVKDIRAKVQSILQEGKHPEILSNQNIERVYPVYPKLRQSVHVRTLSSPLETLKKATTQLASLATEALVSEDSDPSTEPQTTGEARNAQMLDLVRDIHERDLKLCAALLGGFMEQQIQIPLLKSPADTARVLSSKADPVAVGVWALFSRGLNKLQNILSQMEGNPLVVEIADYIAGVFSEKRPQSRDRRYAAKLQFLLQGINKTVSCSSQYISYSLEYQLCNNAKVAQCKSISVGELIEKWDKIFAGDALSLVACSHRPLIARWLKWAILVHDLREALAKYTCIGVTGLVNSGKSKLVNTLFNVPTLVGTRSVKRTTVPFMYNLDSQVDGLDVIDFPGMDAKDHCVLELTQLLVRLVQVVIFVVDYSNATSDAAKEWIHALDQEDVPVLVCLTHADRLYVELMEEDGTQDEKRRQIGRELEVLSKTLGHHQSRKMKFFSFYKPPGLPLTREVLEKVGIGSVHDVGEWLVETFGTRLDQKDMAEKLSKFFRDRSSTDS